MQTSLSQMVALTCYGNALLGRFAVPPFGLTHSTSLYCEFVRFVAGAGMRRDPAPAEVIAATPEAWLAGLERRGIVGLGLHQRVQNLPGISDRNASAFAGGGRLWRIEALANNGQSEFWISRWNVGNREAADRRIWRVTYALSEMASTVPFRLSPLATIAADLGAALSQIRTFAERQNCGNFIPYFDQAIQALGDPEADIGFHKDLAPPGFLSSGAGSLLKAAQAAWVFGGMGSWNDMGFAGGTQAEYERVSDRLFDLLGDATEAAATSSQPIQC
jgi:hypothetical protein